MEPVMNRPGLVIFFLLLVALISFSAYWLYSNFEWVNEKQEVGFQGLAKKNTLLASEFFLRKMGVNVQQVNALVALRNLPAKDHTLLIATQRTTLNQLLSEKLLAWVASGGHLIVEAKHFSASDINNNIENLDDELLKDWSVYSKRVNNKDDQPVSIVLHPDKRIDENELKVKFSDQRSLSFINDKDSESSIHWSIKNNDHYYLAQFLLGKGLLTILNSTDLFNNDNIADYDHAYFLHYLVQQPDNKQGVWLIRMDDMPALLHWLWQNARFAMISLFAVLVLFLWRSPFRFGPLLNDKSLERRSLLEHIHASGYYRWKNKQSGLLLKQVQNRLWLKIQRIHPGITQEETHNAYVLLETITGIEKKLLKMALDEQQELTKEEFVQKISLLKQIEQHV